MKGESGELKSVAKGFGGGNRQTTTTDSKMLGKHDVFFIVYNFPLDSHVKYEILYSFPLKKIFILKNQLLDSLQPKTSRIQ